jgi:hypothetical protein
MIIQYTLHANQEITIERTNNDKNVESRIDVTFRGLQDDISTYYISFSRAKSAKMVPLFAGVLLRLCSQESNDYVQVNDASTVGTGT